MGERDARVAREAPAESANALGIPDDAELLRRSRGGDEQAFSALLGRHARYLYGTALSLTAQPADAEDVVQETLTAVIAGGLHFRGASSVRTWMVQILVRQAALSRRKQQRPAESASQVDEKTAAAREAARQSDAKLDLAMMLQELSPEHREVIVMRELESMSYDEMAAELGVPRGTIESRLHRAREAMRKRFGEYLKP